MGSLARVFRPDTPYPEFVSQLNNYTKTLDNQNRFEIVGEGISSFPTVTVIGTAAGYSENQGTTTITHNLGFAPIVHAFIRVNGIRAPLNYSQMGTTDGAGPTPQAYWWTITVRSNATQASFRSNVLFHFNSAGDATLQGESVQYYLLRATAGSI